MKIILRYLVWILLSMVFLAACTTAQFAPSRLDMAYPVRTPPPGIEIFRSSTPTKKYLEIGAISACCSMDANEMMGLLRDKASESGGDAVMGLEINARGGVSATVIRYE